MSIIKQIKNELMKSANLKKKIVLMSFFKTGPGQYGESDKFIGVVAGVLRKIAIKYYTQTTFQDIAALLDDEIHECRLTAIFILIKKFETSKTDKEKSEIVNLYISKIHRINSWDIVDLSAPKILGAYLLNREKDILYEFANTEHLWKQRIAIVSTLHFIKNNDFVDALKISEILLNQKQDLIQKAVGWMLREIGKMDLNSELKFLDKHYKIMPRTMLRYAIEKFSVELRKKYLSNS